MDRVIVHTLPYAILPLTDDKTEKKFNVSNQVEGSTYVARNHEAGSQDDMTMFVTFCDSRRIRVEPTENIKYTSIEVIICKAM